MAESGRQPSDSSPDAGDGRSSNGPSVNDQYFCYSCDRQVSNIGQDFACPNCHQGFLEKVESNEPEHSSNNSASRPDENEMSRMLGQMLGPMLFGASGGASSSQGGGAPAQDMFQQFLQQLVGNLGATGGRVQFEFSQGGGAGPGGGTFSFGMPLHSNVGDYAWGPGGLDEIVTQLLNQFEGGAPPMGKEQIDRIPTITIDKEQTEKRLQCTTCMEDFNVGEKVRQLPCRHCFHSECIIPWLERHNTCPICRMVCNDVSQRGAAGSNPNPPSSGASGTNTRAANNRNPTIMDQIDELD